MNTQYSIHVIVTVNGAFSMEIRPLASSKSPLQDREAAARGPRETDSKCSRPAEVETTCSKSPGG